MAELFRRLAAFAARRSTLVLICLALVTGAMGLLAARLRIDSGVSALLPNDAQQREMIEKYGSATKDIELLVVTVRSEELMTLETLAMVEALASQLAALEDVEGSLTPFNVPGFTAADPNAGGRVTLSTLAPGGRAPADAGELARFEAAIAAGAAPGLEVLLSDDRRALNLFLAVRSSDDYTELLREVRAVVDGYQPPLEVALAGWLPIYETTREHVLGDLPLLGGIAAAITLLAYLAMFASLRAALLPLLTISVSLIWTLGVMGAVGVPLTVVSLLIPPLIYALGSSYSIHILSHYYGSPAQTSRAVEPLAKVVGGVSHTVVLAALTTAAGFSSLLLSGLPRIREFGIFSAVGILICAAVSLVLYPALLARFRLPPAGRLNTLVGRVATRLGRMVTANPRAMRLTAVAAMMAMALMVAVSLTVLRVETDFTTYFRWTPAALQDNRRLMQEFGSFIDLNVTVSPQGGVDALLTDRELLAQLTELESQLLEHPDVSHVTSIAAYLRALDIAATGQASAAPSPAVVGLFQRLLRAALSAEAGLGDSLTALVDAERGIITTRIWVRDDTTKWFLVETELRDLLAYVTATAERVMPPATRPEVWGWSLVTLRVVELLAREQIVSILVSAALVLTLASIAFRSLRHGALTMVPLATALMLTFSLMAFAGIPLDVLTITFASVAIGVGVDDSIHFLLHYRHALGAGDKAGDGEGIVAGDDGRAADLAGGRVGVAVTAAMDRAGRAIIITTICMAAGVLALTVSRFLPVAYFGALLCFTLVGATSGTLVLLPALLGHGRRARGTPARGRTVSPVHHHHSPVAIRSPLIRSSRAPAGDQAVYRTDGSAAFCIHHRHSSSLPDARP